MVDTNFWNRVKQSQGPRLDFGNFLYDDWGDVPGRTESTQAKQPGTDWQYQTGNPFGMDWARTATPDPSGNLPGTPGYTAPKLDPLNPKDPPHMPNTAGLNNVGTTGGGPADPSWQAIGAGMVRNGWGLDPVGARQNNGIIVGYGSPHQKTIIMPTDYTYGQDTARWEVAGAGVENAMQRALRKTADEMQFNSGLNSMQVLAKWMKFVDNEARQQGKSSGFNMTQMGGQGTGEAAGKATGAQQGGSTVVSPLNSQGQPGQASGAPPTAPGQQMGTPGGAGGLYNTYIGQDKAARMAALLDRLGLGDLAAQYSGAGQAISGMATRMFDPWLTTQGMDPNGQPLMDNVTGLMDQFVNRMKGPGFYQGIQSDARAGLGRLMGGGSGFDPRTTPVNELQQLLEGFNSLISGDMSGNNPWLAEAFGRRPDEALGQYKLAEGRQLGSTGGYLNYYDFLKNDPRFAFLVGQGR